MVFLSCLVPILWAGISLADDSKSDWLDKLTVAGDLRQRVEYDFDSLKTDGSQRDNRLRFRYRLRVSAAWKFSDRVTVGARLRTGVPGNAQSPHFNYGYQGVTSVAFQLDKVFVKAQQDDFWGWVGKNSFPFWKQNELFWDDDIVPEGVAAGASLGSDTLKGKVVGGAFIMNHDHYFTTENSALYAGQLALEVKTKPVNVTVASGYYQFENMDNVPEWDISYTDARYRLDYKFIVSSLQVGTSVAKIPLKFGFDHMVNLEDYSGIDEIDETMRDQKMGFVGSVKVGQTQSKGDWLIAYYYAHKEQYSVVDYICEDDWVRWGNIHRNRATNYAGHEVRLGYAFGPKINTIARIYTVKALRTTGVAKETGSRVRLDVNLKF